MSDDKQKFRKLLFSEFEGKDATVISKKGLTYIASKVEIIGDYMRFREKYGRLVLIDLKSISSIDERNNAKQESLEDTD